MTQVTITIPGSVWDDALDPTISDIQTDLGLPKPTSRKVGKGWQARYETSPETALELASYLRDRGGLLLANSDPETEARERGTYRSMIRTADKIRATVKEATQ